MVKFFEIENIIERRYTYKSRCCNRGKSRFANAFRRDAAALNRVEKFRSHSKFVGGEQ